MNAPRAVDSDTIYFSEITAAIRRGRRWLVAGILAGLALATAVLALIPPRFSSTSTVIVRAAESSTGALSARLGGSIAGVASGLMPGGLIAAPIETELQVLQSRSLAGEIVDSLQLQVRLRSGPRVAPWQLFHPTPIPGSFQRRRVTLERQGDQSFRASDAGLAVVLPPAKSTTRLPEAIPQRLEADILDREEAITRLLKRLTVSKAGGEVVSIAYAADDSLTAAVVPNLLIRRYLARRKTSDRGLNQRRVEFLTAQVDSLEQSLVGAEQALRDQQERSGILDPVVTGKLELEQAGELRRSSASLDVERGALSLLLNQLAIGQVTSTQLAAFPTFLKSPGINDLLSQLSALQTRYLQLQATFTPEEPSVVAAHEAMTAIERQIASLAKTYATTLDRQRAELDKQLDALRNTIQKLPATSELSVRLQRRVLALGQLSAAVRAQLVEARLAAVGEGGDVRSLDVAQPPRKISFPQPGLTLAAGLGGGVVLGLLLALIGGAPRRYVSEPSVIAQVTGVPTHTLSHDAPIVLGALPPGGKILVVPLTPAIDTRETADRIVRAAAARGWDTDQLVVRLGAISTDATIATLAAKHPVVLVGSRRGVDRQVLASTVTLLDRLGVDCLAITLA